MSKKIFATALAVFAAASLTANSGHAQWKVDLNLNQEDVRIIGEQFGEDFADSSGYALAYGDIDKDGFDDVVIGAPYADPISGAIEQTDAGKVYIIYGDATFTPPNQILNLPGPFFPPHQRTVIEGATRFDRLGWSVATGDIDKDGFPDVIIGAPFADSFGDPEAPEGGQTYVVYSQVGGATLKGLTISLASPPANRVTEINGAGKGIHSGWSVASGDIDNDGFADILIGAPFASNTYANPLQVPRPEAGASYVVYGSGSLPKLPLSHYFLKTPSPITSLIEIIGEQPGDHSGWSVASGDINSDDGKEVIIGAPNSDLSISNGGATYVVSGINGNHLTIPAVFPTPFDLASPPAPIVTVLGFLKDSYSGWSVASGNIDDPPGKKDDLIIGIPFADKGGPQTGEANVFFDKKLLPGKKWQTSIDADFVLLGDTQFDRFGWAVGSGDIDGDKRDDVLIGAPIAGSSTAGEAYAFFGLSILNEIAGGNSVVFAAAADLKIFGDDEGDLAGFSVAAGNLNKLGGEDFTLGGPGAERLAGTRTSGNGETYVVYGCQINAQFTVSPVKSCVNDLVTFTDNSTSIKGPIVSWKWDFGDGGMSNLQNPTHTYTAPGTYTVKLTVTDSIGCMAMTSTPVFVNQATANFTFTPAMPCVGDLVQFTDASTSSSGPIASWLWDFGDSGTSPLQNPTHTYTSAGTFTVTVKVIDTNGCKASVSKTIKVNPLPVANFTFTPTIPCAGETVQFTDASSSAGGAIASWMWDFGDAGTSTLQNPTHTYAAAGTFIVTLKVTDVNDCKASVSKTIKVNPAPTANFTFTPPKPCVGDLVQFTDASSSAGGAITSWMWDFGDGGTSPLQNPTHTYTAAGTFTVTLKVADVNGCKGSTSRTITVFLVTADFTFNPAPACVGDLVQFTDASTSTNGAIVSRMWDFGDSGMSTLANPTHTYTAAGTYTVTLQVADANGCKGSVSKTIKVNPLPTANFTFTLPVACAGEPIKFTDASSSPGGAITNWLWNFGDGNTSTVQNPTHAYATGGNFTVTLQVTDVNGCKASASKTVKVNPAPTADFTFTPSGSCVGDKIQFTDGSSSTGGAIVSWSWSFGDASLSDLHGGSSTLPNPVYTYAAAGTYTVTLTVTDVNGCKATKTKTVTVRALDHVPPFCGFAIDANNNVVITITDQDDAGTGGGIAEINVLINHNGMPVFDRPLVPCVTKYLKINVQPINPAFPANFMFEVKDCCGNVTVCDPVFFRAEASGSGRYEFKVSNMDRYLYVQNDGLSKIDIRINNRPLELLADPLRRNLQGHRQYMPWRGDIGVDVASFMTEMENDVVIQVSGPATASAMIVFADVEFPVTSPAVLPQEFTLLQNYPNPFNPSTMIEYTVPATFTDGAKVELVIYNIIGQPVKILENGFKTPNLYTVNWDGTDESGRVVPTGIYLYRIKVGNFTAIKRMSLMK